MPRLPRTVALLVVTGALALTACSGDDAGDDAAATPTTTSERTPATASPATSAPSPGATTATTAAPSAGCEPARPADAGTSEGSLRHGGLERTYRLSVPPGYDGTAPAPLVLNLHGFAGTGEGQDQGTNMPEQAGRRGYVVVSPDGAPLAAGGEGFAGTPFWNFFGSGGVDFGDDVTATSLPSQASDIGADDVGFLTALVDEVSSELCIDADRVYATGMSNGAGMSTTLACERGERFAAIAPVSGVNLSGVCPGDEPVPVLAIHGDADSIAAYEGNFLMGFELGNPSVPERMEQWARRNRCATTPALDEPVTGVVRSTWPDCAPGVDTELWTVTGGEHVWPNTRSDPPGPFDATEVVLDFFDAHVLAARGATGAGDPEESAASDDG